MLHYNADFKNVKKNFSKVINIRILVVQQAQGFAKIGALVLYLSIGMLMNICASKSLLRNDRKSIGEPRLFCKELRAKINFEI
jgi:hypothetical protein